MYFGAFVTIGARRFCPEYGSETAQIGVVNLFFYRYLCSLFCSRHISTAALFTGHPSAAGLVVTFV